MAYEQRPPRAGFSFSKKDRLLKPDEFRLVCTTGARVRAGGFTMYLLPNRTGARRLGVSVGASAGGAVERNRLKRYFREFFRLNRALFPESTDTVIAVKKRLTLKDYREAAGELTKALKQKAR